MKELKAPNQRSEKAVVQAIRKSLELVHEAPILAIACSGGVDSSVLAAGLMRLHEAQAKKVFLFHVNHRQHDLATDAQDQVRELAAQTGAIFISEQLNLPVGQSEMALRKARYGAFSKMMAQASLRTESSSLKSPPVLFQAHHRDDALETYVMRLLRGAHPESFSGIPKDSFYSGDNGEVGFRIIRPLLYISKEELLFCASRWAVRVVEDPTNALPITIRNRVRNELVPLLKDIKTKSTDHLHDFFLTLENQNEQLERPKNRKLQEFLESHLVSSQKARLRRSHWESLFASVLKAKQGDGKRRCIQFPGDVKVWVEKKQGVEIYSAAQGFIAKISLQEI